MAPPSVQITLLRVKIRNRDIIMLIHDTRYMDVIPMSLLLDLIRYLYTGSSKASLRVVLIGWEKTSTCSQILLRLGLKYIDAENGQLIFMFLPLYCINTSSIVMKRRYNFLSIKEISKLSRVKDKKSKFCSSIPDGTISNLLIKSLSSFKIKKCRRVVEQFRNKWIHEKTWYAKKIRVFQENQKQPTGKGL